MNCGEHLFSKICSPFFISAPGLKDNICLVKRKLISKFILTCSLSNVDVVSDNMP